MGIYINFPVSDLAKSTAFYEALGFKKDTEFSDEKASAMIYDDHLWVMLLSEDFFRTFLPQRKVISDSRTTTEVLNALSLDSREAVDTFYEKAIIAWASKTVDAYDYGFMYGRDFEDPDGHIWEAFWMDPKWLPKE